MQLADAGAYPVSNTPLVKGMIGYDPSLENSTRTTRPRRRRLLKAAGWTKSGRVLGEGRQAARRSTSPRSRPRPEYPLLAQAIQGYLRKAGMDASVQQMAAPAWLAANIKGDMSLTPLQYIGVDPDALHLWFLPDQYFNWSHYTDPTADASCITRASRSSIRPSAPRSTRQAQKIIMDQAVEMPIHQNIDLVMTTKKLTGLTWSGGGFEYFGAASVSK